MRRLLRRAQGTLLLVSLTLGLCYLYCFQYGVFGAKVDWISQHSVLPDYFRQQFYETGELFPEFAANIGGGQNIYNFAYYGLYNPVLMLSYLLPFVKMSDYMMAVQFLSLLASVLLMYAWLGKRGFPQVIRAGVAVMFLLSGPMIYHSYSQIMFVNYMPFLILGLWGVDRYFESGVLYEGKPHERKYGRRSVIWLTVSIFFMIMTSFYFSIGGMLVLMLYGVHRFFAVCDGRGVKVTFRLFFKEGVKFAAPFVLAVMMSGILLVPTALALTGREGTHTGTSLLELLIPAVPASRFCYSTHGIGLTTLALTALIALMFGKKLYNRILAWGCMAVLTVPVFAYLLNGGLYVRDKAMIPFLPLLCYVLACYLDDLSFRKVLSSRKVLNSQRELCLRRNRQDAGRTGQILPYVLTVVLIYVCRRQGEAGKYWKLLLLDGIVMLVCFAVISYCRIRLAGRITNMRECGSAVVLMAAGITMLIVFGNGRHAQGAHAVSREFYQSTTDSHIGELITKAVKEEDGFYRTEQLGSDTENAANLNRIWNMGQYISSVYSSSYHEGYREFREDIFQLEEPFRNFLMQSAVHNPVYQRFMGVKYIVSEEEVPGYEEITGEEEELGNEERVPGNKGITGEEEELRKEEKVSGDEGMTGNEGMTESRGNLKIYRNDQVSPFAYATDRVITEEEYKELEFPYNQLALLEYAVVKDSLSENVRVRESKAGNNLSETLAKAASPVDIQLPEKVKSKENQTIHLNLPDLQAEGQKEKVLFLKFRVENLRPSKDVTVWVEGIRNKLTAENHFYYNGNTEFTYAVPVKSGQKSVEVVLGKGQYRILDAETYLGVLPDESDVVKEDGGLYQSELRIDRNRTKGNCIAGNIDVKQPGYFITTIPYDEHFEIRVDDQEVESEEVNTAFLGFEIGAGEHEIEILYHAPGMKAGKVLSAAGVLIFVLVGFFRAFGYIREQKITDTVPKHR